MLCLLTVGGCSRAPAHRAADPLPVPLDGAAAVPVEQAVVLHRAEERAIASCMRRRGFSYRAVPAARPVSENPYGLLDGRITLSPPEKPWSASIWARNIGNKVYRTNIIDILGDAVSSFGTPRTFGVELSTKF